MMETTELFERIYECMDNIQRILNDADVVLKCPPPIEISDQPVNSAPLKL